MITQLTKTDLNRYLYTTDIDGNSLGGRLKEYDNKAEVAVISTGDLSKYDRVVRYEYLELPGFFQCVA